MFRAVVMLTADPNDAFIQKLSYGCSKLLTILCATSIHGQRQGLVPVCGHTVIADFSASPDGGHTGTEVS